MASAAAVSGFGKAGFGRETRSCSFRSMMSVDGAVTPFREKVGELLGLEGGMYVVDFVCGPSILSLKFM